MKKKVFWFFLFGGIFTYYGLFNIYQSLAGYAIMDDLPRQAILIVGGGVLLAIGFIRMRKNRELKAARQLPAEPVNAPAAPAPLDPVQVDGKTTVEIPERVGDEILVYRYDHVRFDAFPGASDLVAAAFQRGEYELHCSIDGDAAVFFTSEGSVGRLAGSRLVSMLADWLKKGDSFKVVPESIKEDQTDGFLFLVFYRDEQKRLAHRENAVYQLTRYASEDCQLALMGLEPGTKLDFEEDMEDDSLVWITCGSAIGALPSGAAQQYISEGAAGVFLESAEPDEDKGLTVPSVRVYW